MKLELLQENLSTALSQLHRIVPNKPQLPILSSILIEANNNSITLSATDLYLGIKTTVAGKTITAGSIAIPGKIFYNTINSLNPGKITLSLTENTLVIISQNNKTSLQCMSAQEFPEFPQLEDQKYSLSASTLKDIWQKVSFSASIDPTRPVLTSLLFDFSQEGLLVVGTDGFRLATLRLENEKMSDKTQFLIPAKAIGEVTKISSNQDSDTIQFTVSEELKQVVFTVSATQIFVRLIEGDYPPFRKIIPAQYSLRVELDGAELESQLKRAQIFARESSNIIRFRFKQDTLSITAVSSAYGKHEGRMPAKIVDGGEGEIAFNSKYLLDFMSAIKPTQLEFFMNESLTPAMLRAAGEENYQYVVMPFRVNE